MPLCDDLHIFTFCSYFNSIIYVINYLNNIDIFNYSKNYYTNDFM